MSKLLNCLEMKPKALIGIFLSIVSIVISLCFPSMGNLSIEGIRTIGLLIAFLIILITEALPVVVTSFLFIGLMPLIKVAPNLQVALGGFSQPVVFFTLASFGLAAAFTTTPLAKRALKKIIKLFGNSIDLVLLALMSCTVFISSIISNVPTCAVFMAISLNFLELYNDENEKRKTGKAFMIAIPIASMIGGMITPVGSSINLIAIGLLEEFSGSTITFVEWMLVGTPLALIMLPIAWLLISKIYKPAKVSKERIQEFADNMDIPNKITPVEIKALIIAGIMLVLWILSSWFPFFNVMVIAILGCVALFLPGIKVLNVDTFLKENSWDAFFLVGAVLSIGAAMNTNGVINVIATSLPALDLPLILVLAIIALIVFLLLIVLPVATSLVSLVGTVLMVLGLSAGVDPILTILVVALCACNCYLLPLDTVALITYSKGYYSMTDMLKSTSILQVIMIILCALWIPLIGMLLGII